MSRPQLIASNAPVTDQSKPSGKSANGSAQNAA
jgi:hypothetical protein